MRIACVRGCDGGIARVACVAFLATALAAAAQVTIYRKGGGEPILATGIRFIPDSDSYNVSVGSSQVTIPRSQVERVDAPKPKALDEAAKLVAGGQPDAAIPILQKIISEYATLQWESEAKKLLAEAYVKKGDSASAAQTYGELAKGGIGAGPGSLRTRIEHWKAMLGAQQYDALQKDLDGVIAKGSRAEAAAALTMRGDLRRAQNRTQDALLDYLRTVILFGDIEPMQPEALFRAAELMDVIRDPRATDLRKRLTQKYPNTDFARKAGGQL